MENKDQSKFKPKQYTHIDYEALLIYVMKNRTSVENAVIELELKVARSTIVRNINKLKEQGSQIVRLYQEEYATNMQKKELPVGIAEKIDQLPKKEIRIKNELEDVYFKLTMMKEILDSCDGNLTQAARVISSGNTPLGNFKITRQGLTKDLKYYEKVKEKYQIQKDDLEPNERRED